MALPVAQVRLMSFTSIYLWSRELHSISKSIRWSVFIIGAYFFVAGGAIAKDTETTRQMPLPEILEIVTKTNPEIE